jgi:hypothetical protein
MAFAFWLSRSGLLKHRVPSATLRTTAALLAVGTLALGGCSLFSPKSIYPEHMTQEARAVRVYFSGEQPECIEILSLGKVQAKAGGYLDPKKPKIQVNMDAALAWLRLETWKMGGNGVRLLEHKGNSDDTIHMAIGEAIFCRTASQ